MLLTAFFSVVCLTAPKAIMALYSDDADTVAKAAVYLKWRTLEFLPSALTLFFSTMLRNMNKAKLPAIAGIVSIFSNTLFNWLLIFGIGIFPRMEEAGAAMATSIARFIEMAIILALFAKEKKMQDIYLRPSFRFSVKFLKNIAAILVPILIGEFLWSLGENVYAGIYGHLGKEPCAAMTLMYPIQGIAIGSLGGVASAAGIITGNSLGANNQQKAWSQATDFVRLTVKAGITKL